MTTPDGPDLVPAAPGALAGTDGPLADGSGGSTPVRGTCTSCGAPDEPVQALHRVYVTPPELGAEERIEVADEVETWCVVCLGHYPHQLVGGSEVHNR